MKYSKDKVEAIKILLSEILELNQHLPDNKFVDFWLNGYSDSGVLDVTFWTVNEDGEPDYGDDEVFHEFLGDVDWNEKTFAKITSKMNEWKELYCNEDS